MKPAATQIEHLSHCARLLLGGCLLASLLACNDGGGGNGLGDSKDPAGGGTSGSGSSSSSGSGGSSSSATEDVVWKELVNTTVNGDTLKKTGGCDGCLDAGAESRQYTASGNGYLEFTVNETSRIRYIGL